MRRKEDRGNYRVGRSRKGKEKKGIGFLGR